mgnify:FL=1
MCDPDNEECLETINKFVDKPEELVELCDLEDEVCIEEIDEFLKEPEIIIEQ